MKSDELRTLSRAARRIRDADGFSACVDKLSELSNGCAAVQQSESEGKLSRSSLATISSALGLLLAAYPAYSDGLALKTRAELLQTLLRLPAHAVLTACLEQLSDVEPVHASQQQRSTLEIVLDRQLTTLALQVLRSRAYGTTCQLQEAFPAQMQVRGGQMPSSIVCASSNALHTCAPGQRVQFSFPPCARVLQCHLDNNSTYFVNNGQSTFVRSLLLWRRSPSVTT